MEKFVFFSRYIYKSIIGRGKWMKVQAIQDGAMNSYSQVVTQGKDKDFGQLLEGLQQVTEQLNSGQNVEMRELSFREMIDIEHNAIVAFRQSDLIGYERYMKELNGHQGALERVNTAAAAYATEANLKNGMFPEDAPQSVKSYVSGLSMKERMVMFTQVAVQDIIANAYQDGNGRWRIRHRDEPGYVNIFEQPDFSYTKLVEKMLENIELNRKFTTQENYQEQLDVILGLKEAVEGF